MKICRWWSSSWTRKKKKRWTWDWSHQVFLSPSFQQILRCRTCFLLWTQRELGLTGGNCEWLYVALQTEAGEGHPIILKILGDFFLFLFFHFYSSPTSSKSLRGFHSAGSFLTTYLVKTDKKTTTTTAKKQDKLFFFFFISVALIKAPNWELSHITTVQLLVVVRRSSGAHEVVVEVNMAHTAFISRLFE